MPFSLLADTYPRIRELISPAWRLCRRRPYSRPSCWLRQRFTRVATVSFEKNRDILPLDDPVLEGDEAY
jgi:hypothetical protein